MAGHRPRPLRAGALKLADIVQGDGIALLAAPPADDEMRNRTAIIDLDLMRANGQSLPVRLLHRVPVTVDGAPGATRTVVLNRSPGEEGSEALRAAEVRFARFFNNTPIAIAAIDRQGRIGRTNAPFLRMFPGVRPDGAAHAHRSGRRPGQAQPRRRARRRRRRRRASSRRSTRRSPARASAPAASSSIRSPRAPAAARW